MSDNICLYFANLLSTDALVMGNWIPKLEKSNVTKMRRYDRTWNNQLDKKNFLFRCLVRNHNSPDLSVTMQNPAILLVSQKRDTPFLAWFKYKNIINNKLQPTATRALLYNQLINTYIINKCLINDNISLITYHLAIMIMKIRIYTNIVI